MKYKRILLKLSGEGLSTNKGEVFNFSFITSLSNQLKQLQEKGFQIGIVIGGGNIWRGAKISTLERVNSDNIGMLATVINSLVLSEFFTSFSIKNKVFSSIFIDSITEKFNINKVLNSLEKGDIVIFAGGTGNSHFTTDTAAVLKAVQIKADILLKGTNVDGVYDKNPSKFKDAKFLDKLTYDFAIEHNLKVMDLTSIALAKEYNLPLKVFNIHYKDAIIKAIYEDNFGSKVLKEV